MRYRRPTPRSPPSPAKFPVYPPEKPTRHPRCHVCKRAQTCSHRRSFDIYLSSKTGLSFSCLPEPSCCPLIAAVSGHRGRGWDATRGPDMPLVPFRTLSWFFPSFFSLSPFLSPMSYTCLPEDSTGHVSASERSLQHRPCCPLAPGLWGWPSGVHSAHPKAHACA